MRNGPCYGRREQPAIGHTSLPKRDTDMNIISLLRELKNEVQSSNQLFLNPFTRLRAQRIC
jgi:hypothetical protein